MAKDISSQAIALLLVLGMVVSAVGIGGYYAKVTGNAGIDTEYVIGQSDVDQGTSNDLVTTEDKTELAEDEETQMEENDVREEIVQAIAEVVMPEIEAMKAKMAEHEEKLEEHEEKMNEHYSKTPASESKTATNSFSKTNFNINNNEGPKHNRKRYEMALARLNNKNQ